MNQTVITNLVIGVAVLATLAFTQNPLALLALFFLQSSHPQEMSLSEQLADAMGGEEVPDAEYNEHGAGFTAKI